MPVGVSSSSSSSSSDRSSSTSSSISSAATPSAYDTCSNATIYEYHDVTDETFDMIETVTSAGGGSSAASAISVASSVGAKTFVSDHSSCVSQIVEEQLRTRKLLLQQRQQQDRELMMKLAQQRNQQHQHQQTTQHQLVPPSSAAAAAGPPSSSFCHLSAGRLPSSSSQSATSNQFVLVNTVDDEETEYYSNQDLMKLLENTSGPLGVDHNNNNNNNKHKDPSQSLPQEHNVVDASSLMENVDELLCAPPSRPNTTDKSSSSSPQQPVKQHHDDDDKHDDSKQQQQQQQHDIEKKKNSTNNNNDDNNKDNKENNNTNSNKKRPVLLENLTFGKKYSPPTFDKVQFHLAKSKLDVSRQFGKNVYLCRDFVDDPLKVERPRFRHVIAYVFTHSDRHRAHPYFDLVTFSGIHNPFVVNGSIAYRRSDGVHEVHADFVDGGNLDKFIRAFKQYEEALLNRNNNNDENKKSEAVKHFCKLARVNAAKSIMRQALSGLVQHLYMLNKSHRALSQRTIFYRRDGWIRLGVFDMFTKVEYEKYTTTTSAARSSPAQQQQAHEQTQQQQNQQEDDDDNNQQQNQKQEGEEDDDHDFRDYPREYLTSHDVFRAPELSLHDNNTNNPSSHEQQDVWSLGCTLLCFCLGIEFHEVLRYSATISSSTENNNEQQQNQQEHDQQNQVPQPTPPLAASESSLKLLFDLISPARSTSSSSSSSTTSSPPLDKKKKMIDEDQLWRQAIPDSEYQFRYLLRCMLQRNPTKRISLVDALSLTFLFGGVTAPCSTDVDDLIKLEKENKQKLVELNENDVKDRIIFNHETNNPFSTPSEAFDYPKMKEKNTSSSSSSSPDESVLPEFSIIATTLKKILLCSKENTEVFLPNNNKRLPTRTMAQLIPLPRVLLDYQSSCSPSSSSSSSSSFSSPCSFFYEFDFMNYYPLQEASLVVAASAPKSKRGLALLLPLLQKSATAPPAPPPPPPPPPQTSSPSGSGSAFVHDNDKNDDDDDHDDQKQNSNSSTNNKKKPENHLQHQQQQEATMTFQMQLFQLNALVQQVKNQRESIAQRVRSDVFNSFFSSGSSEEDTEENYNNYKTVLPHEILADFSKMLASELRLRAVVRNVETVRKQQLMLIDAPWHNTTSASSKKEKKSKKENNSEATTNAAAAAAASTSTSKTSNGQQQQRRINQSNSPSNSLNVVTSIDYQMGPIWKTRCSCAQKTLKNIYQDIRQVLTEARENENEKPK